MGNSGGDLVSNNEISLFCHSGLDPESYKIPAFAGMTALLKEFNEQRILFRAMAARDIPVRDAYESF